MLGGMQHSELRVSRVIDHAAREHPTREVITRWADGSETRSDWAGVAAEAKRLARALERIGVRPGDRVATLAMNHGRHLAAWYGVMGMGAVVHTINPRLFDDQLSFIANHAQDRVLLYDRMFQPIVDRLRGEWTSIEHYVVFDPGADPGPGAISFDALIADQSADYQWREGPEDDPCMLCYTSGTTGHPKGVLYSHRSSLLHAMAATQSNAADVSTLSVVLPIVPMFHAAAWGIPFSTAMTGAKLVFSAINEASVLCELMNREQVNQTGGVPTVWFAMFKHIDETGEAPRYLKHALIGGSAAPKASGRTSPSNCAAARRSSRWPRTRAVPSWSIPAIAR